MQRSFKKEAAVKLSSRQAGVISKIRYKSLSAADVEVFKAAHKFAEIEMCAENIDK